MMSGSRTWILSRSSLRLATWALAACCLQTSGAMLYGQSRPDEVISQSSQLLTETMSQPLSKVPRAMIENAHGVAIIPNVVKGSFIVGARHGKGVLFVREPNGTWHAPVFIT